eukprot:CAMPEP_0194550896 /NCGR_PEP_ID=MMETSP0253-20130528/95946_1 /TAXON_ID=2966 /ORGANISM="Noctiluca scintillans" /LENGTH=395 /DNA_ID=CAMNT_0039398345 /DNA_START=302 /DNA_END=1490 /DNA_ORIENTATION=+
MTHLRSLRTEPDKQKRMLRTYFSENDISAELNQRIWTYLHNSHWNLKKRVHERDVPLLKTLPETLKAKLREERFYPTLERAPFPAGMEIYARNQVERIYSVCVLLFAMVTFSSFVSSIASAMTHLRSLGTEPEKQKRMLRTYFSENDVSAELNRRIWTYLQNSHWNLKKHVHEQDIPLLETLPETLKAKLREERFFPTLERAPFLKKFSILHRNGIGAVCFHAVSETSLICTEELFTPGVVADKMYFITMGIMEYQHISLLREEDHELKEKQWVGEPVLWMGGACEIIELSAVEFRKVALASEPSAAFFSEYARLFVDHLVKSDNWATDVWMDEDDLEELVRTASGEDEDAQQTPSTRTVSDISAWSRPSARPSVTSWIGSKTRGLTELARGGTS